MPNIGKNVARLRVLLTLACLFAAPASAHYREACWAHFHYTAGWSGTIAATCQYATGAELNEDFAPRNSRATRATRS